jgi:ribosomal protein L30E
MTTINELKKTLKEKKPIYGYEVAVKKLKNDELEVIYVADNFDRKTELLRLGHVYSTKVVELKEDNNELGVVCRKPFSIAVISFTKK